MNKYGAHLLSLVNSWSPGDPPYRVPPLPKGLQAREAQSYASGRARAPRYLIFKIISGKLRGPFEDIIKDLGPSEPHRNTVITTNSNSLTQKSDPRLWVTFVLAFGAPRCGSPPWVTRGSL